MFVDQARSRAVVLALIFVLAAAAAVSEAAANPLAVKGIAQGLVLTLKVRQRQFALGTPVVVELELLSERTSPITLIVAPLRLFDLLVRDARGVTIWAWTNRPSPLAPPGRRVLNPGDRLRGDVIWDGTIQRGGEPAIRAPAGTYCLVGVLHAPALEIPDLRLRTLCLMVSFGP